MALIGRHPVSIRPSAEARILGVGKGSGTSLSDLFKLGAGAAHVMDIRARADTASGSDARILYSRLHQYGEGGGEAVRAYAFAQNAATATGGTLNGIHASMSIAANSGISGQGSAIRATLEAAAATRTLGGTMAAIICDSNIGANNTMPTHHSFIRFTDVGAIKVGNLFQIPKAANGTIFATHTTQTMSHSIKIIDADGTAYYIMCTDSADNRS